MGNLYEQTNTLLYISELMLLETDEERKQNLTLSEKLDKLKEPSPGVSAIDNYPKAEPESPKKSRKNSSK